VRSTRYPKVLFLVALSIALLAQGNKPPFWQEIREFRKADSIRFPSPHQILFVGSSSIRLWNDLQENFPDYPIINRGFGGSALKDVNFYFNDIIKPYHARQIVIYCGDNDFAGDKELPVDSVVTRLKMLVSKIRLTDENVKITYISIKPSPSRKELTPKFIAANELIRQFLSKQKNTSFVDVYHRMLDSHGSPLKNIFRADSLHMNAAGYAIWQKAIKPQLLKK
jgi:lysophospholipase L1-like esterase